VTTTRDMTSPAHPIHRLRRVAAALECGRPPDDGDRLWFCAAVREYEAAAPAGCTFDRAAGLTPNRGRAPWWVDEARQQRDAVIRRMRDQLFPELRISEAAQQIARLLGRRRALRSAGDSALTDPHRELVAAALSSGAVPLSTRRIEEILKDQIGDLISSI
jgi:hypothetical protein